MSIGSTTSSTNSMASSRWSLTSFSDNLFGMPVASVGEIGSDIGSYIAAGCSQDGRYIMPLSERLDAGELASLVGLPLHNNGDTTDLSLTADEWAALIERRRRVGWPLNFLEVADGV
ncbi:hypothetical protein [Xanthomonas arboricola]|uniref:hypothetical protein n=1 Tax=Xanthomonas arboricola TaxID=56448 RepID=UPI001F38BC6F|nr:hypothetical protein [Xanthomonas arboricola]